MDRIIGIIGARKKPTYNAAILRSVQQCVKAKCQIITGGAVGTDEKVLEYCINARWSIYTTVYIPSSIDDAPTARILNLLISHGGNVYTITDHSSKYASIFMRNTRIAEEAAVIIAFPSVNNSNGTWHTCRVAERLGKTIICYSPGKKPVRTLGSGIWHPLKNKWWLGFWKLEYISVMEGGV